jgi:hypothetical protein
VEKELAVPERSTPNDHPDADTGTPSTKRLERRRVMLGAAAVGAGSVVALVAGGDPAGAATSATAPVELGVANKASATTSVSTASGDGLSGQTSDDGFAGLAGGDVSPKGGYGVRGTSSLGTGVAGASTKGTGVNGSGGASGVTGTSTALRSQCSRGTGAEEGGRTYQQAGQDGAYATPRTQAGGGRYMTNS